MKKIYLLTPLIAMFALTGCFKSEAPKCSDTEVKKTLKKLYAQKMIEMKGNVLTMFFTAAVPKTITSIGAARAISYDEKVNLRSCKAEATLGEGITSAIEYTVQLDEENNGQFYVELQMGFVETLAQQGIMNQLMEEK